MKIRLTATLLSPDCVHGTWYALGESSINWARALVHSYAQCGNPGIQKVEVVSLCFPLICLNYWPTISSTEHEYLLNRNSAVSWVRTRNMVRTRRIKHQLSEVIFSITLFRFELTFRRRSYSTFTVRFDPKSIVHYVILIETSDFSRIKFLLEKSFFDCNLRFKVAGIHGRSPHTHILTALSRPKPEWALLCLKVRTFNYQGQHDLWFRVNFLEEFHIFLLTLLQLISWF